METRTHTDEKRELLRHMLAAVVFRCKIAIAGAPEEFAALRVAGDARPPAEILAHIGDLLTGSLYLLRGDLVELTSAPLSWSEETARFLAAARELDKFLATDEPLVYPVERFVQGPIGDAMTHVGQLVILRRIAGSPVSAAPYFTAEIIAGDF